MDDNLLEITDLSVSFNQQMQQTTAVDAISFDLRRGEILALLGESGCGKSLTALSLLNILPPAAHLASETQINYQQQNLNTLSEAQLRQLRGHKIAMIFQEPMTALNPVLTVGEQINEVLRCHFKLPANKRRQRCIDLLESVGIPEPKSRYKQYPHELSGGMKQRVMIAMALAGEPDILLADEPTTALDVTIQAQVLALLHKLQREQQKTVLLITHDLGVVRQMADRVAVMYAGEIVEQASGDDFFKQPLHPYSQMLFHALPSLKQKDHQLAIIKGQVPAIGEWPTGCRFANRCPKAWDLCTSTKPSLYQAGDVAVRCHLYQTQPKQVVIPLSDVQRHQQKSKNNDKPLLSVKNLHVDYKTLRAVDDVSLVLYPAETLAIVGESGCGKTTLAKTILGLVKSTAGEIELGTERQQLQIVFQDPYASMNPRLMVHDLIAEGLRALPKRISQADITQRVITVLDQVGIPETALWRYPHEFSGGQRQRLCIARALAVNPKIIICDEPTSALDVSVQAQILNLLKQLQHENDLSYLFISHDISVVGYMADRIAVMYSGRIVEEGTAEAILQNAAHPYTQKLLAAVPEVERA